MIKNKNLFIYLVIVGILLVTPIVSSFSFDEIFNGITGLFSRLVTGMATPAVGEGCPCGDGTLPSQCSVVEPWLYCYQNEDDICTLVQACEICGNCPESTPYCTLDGGVINGGVCSTSSEGDGICQDGESCSISDCSSQTGNQADCSAGYFCDYGVCTAEIVCGNNIIEGVEVCDGTNLNGQTCISQGFDSGTLACAASCAGFTTSGCQNDVIAEIVEEDNSTDTTGEVSNCGNGRLDSGEECDGSNLGGWSCLELGLYSKSNSLECGNDCLLDLSSCVDEHEDTVNNVTVDTCGGIGGICMNGCIDGYEGSGNSNLDLECQQEFSITSLVCCVSSDTDSSDGSTNPEFSDISSELKESLEEKNEETNQGESWNMGVNEILTSPRAIGGVWIAFVLSAFVVVISSYVHKRFIGRRNQKVYK